MPKYPYDDTLNPEKALATGLRLNQPPICQGESLIALKTIAASVVDEFAPKSFSEFAWCNILTMSFFRLHRCWFLAAQVSAREQSHGTLFHSVEMDSLRPLIEEIIQSIMIDLETLQDVSRRVLAEVQEIPLAALRQIIVIIQGRDYSNSSPALQEALSDALESLNDTSPEDEIKESTEGVLEALRATIAEQRQSILEIERIRARLSTTSIATSAIHRDSDRLLNQELKLIQNIEKATTNLARLAKMRGA
jgi:DNA repair exonuclease SbcCD ATPase subunit